MSSGGRRIRSGRMVDPNSARSERRGIVLSALPPEGFRGPVPEFPLPDPSERELEVWAEAWRTPQACAWALPTESWRIPTVAMWVRVRVRCEEPKVQATVYAQLHRFADQIGLTTAGLAEMGWRVAEDKAPAGEDAPKPAIRSARDRFKVVGGVA